MKRYPEVKRRGEKMPRGIYLSSYMRPTGVLCAKEMLPLSVAAAADEEEEAEEEEEEEEVEEEEEEEEVAVDASNPKLTSSCIEDT